MRVDLGSDDSEEDEEDDEEEEGDAIIMLPKTKVATPQKKAAPVPAAMTPKQEEHPRDRLSRHEVAPEAIHQGKNP